ncbi:MAG: hypothetical protein V3W41_12905 [Planctomycetota bacterium]
MPADKTPGEVAFRAMTIEVRWRPADWGKLDPKLREGWEAAASAVREQLQEEIKANWAAPGKTLRLLGEVAVEDIVAVAELKKCLAWWHSQDWGSDYHHSLEQLIIAVEPFLPDEPTPEAAEACAENAGAEQSKSRPPVER